MRAFLILLAVSMALSVQTASAQKLYKWVDSQGNVSYHDRPPPANSSISVQEKRIRSKGGAAADAGDDAAQKSPVVLYAVPKCSSCEQARQYLKSRNIPFTDKNVEGDLKVQQELKEKSGSLSVPTIMVGSKVMTGYLESLLAGELDQAGYQKLEPEKKEKTEEEKPADTGFKAPTQ
jgi:glutaredoxin